MNIDSILWAITKTISIYFVAKIVSDLAIGCPFGFTPCPLDKLHLF